VALCTAKGLVCSARRCARHARAVDEAHHVAGGGDEVRSRRGTVRRRAAVGLGEIGLREVGLREVGLREVGLREVGLREVGLREVGLGEVGLGEGEVGGIGVVLDGRLHGGVHRLVRGGLLRARRQSTRDASESEHEALHRRIGCSPTDRPFNWHAST
jgi:hypothetical protein